MVLRLQWRRRIVEADYNEESEFKVAVVVVCLNEIVIAFLSYTYNIK